MFQDSNTCNLPSASICLAFVSLRSDRNDLHSSCNLIIILFWFSNSVVTSNGAGSDVSGLFL